MKILVAEDDKSLSKILEEILLEQKYIVDTVFDGMDAVYYASNQEYDVIIMDIMMPKLNGYDAIKLLRKQNVSTPTIMLTAKSETFDKITGLDSGADDYMTKPFEPEELLARIRAMTRRTGAVLLDEIKIGKLVLNLSTHTLSFDAKSISLNNKEFLLMELFLRSPNKILTKESIINNVWGTLSEAVDNNVEAYISFLRKKLSYLKADDEVQIKTLRRTGYKLEEV